MPTLNVQACAPMSGAAKSANNLADSDCDPGGSPSNNYYTAGGYVHRFLLGGAAVWLRVEGARVGAWWVRWLGFGCLSAGVVC